MTAIRQGRDRVQAVHSAARIRRHCARAAPPGRPTLARTRTATTGEPGAGAGQQLIPVVVEVGEDGLQVGLAKWPHRAAGPILVVVQGPRSRTGHQGYSFLLALAGGPLRAVPATLLARSRLVVALAGRLALVAVAAALLGLDALDGRARPLPGGPLGWVVGLGSEGPVGIGDLVLRR